MLPPPRPLLNDEKKSTQFSDGGKVKNRLIFFSQKLINYLCLTVAVDDLFGSVFQAISTVKSVLLGLDFQFKLQDTVIITLSDVE